MLCFTLTDAYKAVDGETIRILTNDLEMDAQEIGDLYRRRWQIELFFKWIKQHLVVKRLYGKSEWAVHNQIWLALITYCLLVLLSQRIRHKGRLLDVYKCVKHHWADLFAVFIHSLMKRGSGKSRGRRVYPVDKIFEQTLHQYEHGEVEHLDDLTYDPVN